MMIEVVVKVVWKSMGNEVREEINIRENYLPLFFIRTSNKD